MIGKFEGAAIFLMTTILGIGLHSTFHENDHSKIMEDIKAIEALKFEAGRYDSLGFAFEFIRTDAIRKGCK